MERTVPADDEKTRSYEANGTARALQILRITMTAKRKRSRARKRGMTGQSILAVCAVMGCFVYPLSLAMSSTGKRIAQESEKGHDVMLEQAR